MFNNKRIKALEDRNTELSERITNLAAEVSILKAACTMRVGDDTRYQRGGLYWYELPDSRPVATALGLIQQLMERQKLTVEAVPASPAAFVITKEKT